MKKRNEGVRLVETLFGVAWRVYNANLAKILKSIDAAIFYQQCCCWSGKTKDGWFYKTVKEFEAELGMSRYKQNRAIRILQKHELIEKRIGYMGKRYFKITPKINDFAKEKGLLKTSNLDDGKPAIWNDENQRSIYKDYSKIIKDITYNKVFKDKRSK